MAGIAAAAFYLPRYAIAATEYRKAVGDFAAPGVLEKSVPGFDEDEITMAVEAGQRAWAATDMARVGLLALASSAPSLDTETIAIALGFDDVPTKASLGSREALPALDAAVAHVNDTRQSALFLVTDAPRADPSSPAEHPLGAAAVALLLTPRGGVRPVRGTPARRPYRDTVAARVGDAGAATPFLTFLDRMHAARKGDRIPLLVGTPRVFQVAAKPKGGLDVRRSLRSRTWVPYAQYLAMRRYGASPPGTEYSQGAYVSLPTYRAERKARFRLVGERCVKCGRVHFPPRESCLACGGRTWEDVPLARTGSVYTFTIIGRSAAPSEFLEQALAGDYATAVVELDDGPRVTAMLTDVDPKTVKIGQRVRMAFRRLYTQEGVVRYGFKFAPAREHEDPSH